ncbi:hypothetical protein [Streptomyces litchfieldiae]|uniref:Secreted protein n=1 Tax=Streptomyces litchfieldiae TaxID=3075543 RepID=A0ABU2MSR0_9ACTN|nr:hypothetical protein [Streptomyces sp. DSM 44938]MDT0344565.1 hypothetical protein [Streptomyces sp. DSM 44938]
MTTSTMGHTLRKILIGTALSVTALAGTIAFASPAGAATIQCTSYLNNRGYEVTQKHIESCRIGAEGNMNLCSELLVDLGVVPTHAVQACKRA